MWQFFGINTDAVGVWSQVIGNIEIHAHGGQVCVLKQHDAIHMSVAECNIYEYKKYWWISRVKVHRDHQRRGLGTQLVKTMVKKVRSITLEGYRIVVAPGGYDTDPDALVKFYEGCGFSTVRDDGGDDDGLMYIEL